MHMASCCPVCARHSTLIALGTRRDRPHRWRPWITTLTHLYLCGRCDAIVAQRTAHALVPESVPAADTPRGPDAGRVDVFQAA